MLKSISPGFKKTYVGYTHDLKSRLDKHNSNKGAKSTMSIDSKAIPVTSIWEATYIITNMTSAEAATIRSVFVDDLKCASR